MILGNIVAGDRVWPSGPAPPVRSIEPIEANKQGDWVTEVPKDCTAGVTGAKSRAGLITENVYRYVPPLTVILGWVTQTTVTGITCWE